MTRLAALLRANALYCLAMAAAAWAGVAWHHGGFVHDAVCVFSRVLPVERDGINRLLRASNVDQTILRADATVADAPADAPGWRALSGKGSGPSRLVVRAWLTGEPFILYPRFASPGDRLVISQLIGQDRKVLYDQRGREQGWSAVGAMHTLCVGCTDQGWAGNANPVDLEIVLYGQGVQLWHKDGFIFF